MLINEVPLTTASAPGHRILRPTTIDLSVVAAPPGVVRNTHCPSCKSRNATCASSPVVSK